jgi:radical SAM family RiPP maturation amino acid epimerase
LGIEIACDVRDALALVEHQPHRAGFEFVREILRARFFWFGLSIDTIFASPKKQRRRGATVAIAAMAGAAAAMAITNQSSANVTCDVCPIGTLAIDEGTRSVQGAAMRLLPPATVTGMLARMQSLSEAGIIRQVYGVRGVLDADYARELAEVKRFLERWTGDAGFRSWFAKDQLEAGCSLGLSVDPRQLNWLIDEDVAIATPDDQIPLVALRYRAFCIEKLQSRDEMRLPDPTLDPAYSAWRERQMRRVEVELHRVHVDGIIHAPFCIELCNGCSVGCWFCGVSAPKLGDIFFHTAENAALFRSVIEATQEIFGDGAKRGFLYWATDPLDNPDYEAFMSDFHALIGERPQTTTALALKDINRTRALVRLSANEHSILNRFSLLSLKQLNKVHDEFTPEELLFVELVLQNKEGTTTKVGAGRASERRTQAPTNPDHKGNQIQSGTIACVSGFLINMVSRTVKLMSPCQPSARWPLGYIVFGEGTFSSAAEFRDLIHRLKDEHMAPLRDSDPVSFNEHLRYEPVEQGFRLETEYQTVSFDSNPIFGTIGNVLRQGGAGSHASQITVEQVVETIADQNEVDPAEVLYALQLLHNRGVIDTLPPAPAAGLVQVRL